MVFARMLSRGIAPFEFLKMHLYQYTQKIQLCSNRFDFLPLFLSGRVSSKFVVTRFSRMVHKGLLYKNGEAGARLCVPREAQEDRNENLKMVHDHPTASHQGKHRTAALAMANFYWSGMRST